MATYYRNREDGVSSRTPSSQITTSSQNLIKGTASGTEGAASTLTVPKGFFGFLSESEIKNKKEEMKRLHETRQTIFKYLGEMERINILMGHNQETAPVENLKERIREAMERIEKLMSPEAEQQQELKQNAEAGPDQSGYSLAEHPDLPIQDGLPIEKLPKEWREMFEDNPNVQDISELENRIRKKAEERMKDAAKLVNKLTNKLKNKPGLKQEHKLMLKLKQKMELKAKPVLDLAPKPTPTPPAPAPRYYDKPRPPS